MSGQSWTDEEIGFLQDHSEWPPRKIAEELNRSVSSVKSARHKLRHGWTGNQNPAWSEDELQILSSAPATVTAESLCELLPGRRLHAIRKRRIELGIKTRGNRPTEIGSRPLVAKTCLGCGLLLAGSWFHSVKARGVIKWSPHCKRCSSEKAMAWTKAHPERSQQRSSKYEDRLQSLSLQTATRVGEPYTEADYAVLADQTLTDFQKATRLGRSFKAIKSARNSAGLKSKPEGLGDPERDVWVISNPNLPIEGAA